MKGEKEARMKKFWTYTRLVFLSILPITALLDNVEKEIAELEGKRGP